MEHDYAGHLKKSPRLIIPIYLVRMLFSVEENKPTHKNGPLNKLNSTPDEKLAQPPNILAKKSPKVQQWC